MIFPGAGYFQHSYSKAAETPGLERQRILFRNAIVSPPPASLGIDANFSLCSLTHSLLLRDSQCDLGFLKPLSVGNCPSYSLTPPGQESLCMSGGVGVGRVVSCFLQNHCLEPESFIWNSELLLPDFQETSQLISNPLRIQSCKA